MTNNLSAYHISTHLNDYEAARTGFFSLIVSGLNEIPAATFKGEGNPTDNETIGKQAEEYITLNVVKANVPHFSLTKLTYKRGNDVVHFAGIPEFQSGEITVDDVVGLDTKSILMAWQAQAYNVHTRKGGRMKDYKKTCTLIEYTQDFEQIRSWELQGCWIQDIQEDSFDKGADNNRQIRATIVYDRAIMSLDATEAPTEDEGNENAAE